MNKSNDIEIDFIKIAKILIKEKTILLGTSLLIGIIALLYSLQLPKKYETTVVLHKPSINFFQNFINFYSKEDYEKFKNDYYSNFIDQVSSMTNISEFINNSSSYKIFKEKVEKNNVNLQSFFKLLIILDKLPLRDLIIQLAKPEADKFLNLPLASGASDSLNLPMRFLKGLLP